MVFFTLIINFVNLNICSWKDLPSFRFVMQTKIFFIRVIVFFIQGGLYLMNYRNLPATSSLELINNIDIISVPHIASHTSWRCVIKLISV